MSTISPPKPVPEPVDVPRAKPLPRRLPVSGAPPDLVPARMVNEVLYCERLMYLEWAQGEFADNYFTVDGRAAHRRADSPGGELPPPKDDGDKGDGAAAAPPPELKPKGPDDRPYQARSVWLSSEKLGITAKIDIIEGDENGRVLPIEYKRGEAPDIPEGAYLPERAQICVQVLVLRDSGYSCDEGAIYFAGSRKRVPIAISDELVETTKRAIARAKELVTVAEMPPPLSNSPKCNGCSLSAICLPDETTLLARLDGTYAPPVMVPDIEATPAAEAPLVDAESWDPAGPIEPAEPELRRLHPARDDAIPVYVHAQGGRISLTGERLIIWTKEGEKEAKLPNTSQVSIFGNIQITTQAMRELMERGIPVMFFTRGGWFCGRLLGNDTKNVELRVAQYRAAMQKEVCLSLARTWTVAKVKNCRTLLRRNLVTEDGVALFELDQLARKADDAEALESLLGIEGSAARVYFGKFPGMFRDAPALAKSFEEGGRNRRPPRDPVNAMLSFAYALLVKDVVSAVTAVGLDPLLGFYHQPRFGRPALALDLMEEFRPLIADSVVLTVVNNAILGERDFDQIGNRCNLRQAARRNFILAYERRMDQLVTHPVFGYRISYRRVLEVQARLLTRVLLGEIPKYPSFRTR